MTYLELCFCKSEVLQLINIAALTNVHTTTYNTVTLLRLVLELVSSQVHFGGKNQHGNSTNSVV